MSRRPQQFQPSTPNLVGPPVDKLNRMRIVKVNSNGSIDQASKQLGILLLNPEAIEDSKTSNWVASSIPGQSSPIYQWVSGGPREVSFEALVTHDTSDFLKQSEDPLAGLVDSAVNAVGNIASKFLGVNLPPLANLFSSTKSGSGEDLSITNQLNYYRSLLYPTYAQGRLETSAPLIALWMGKTLGDSQFLASDTVAEDTDLWILTELKIRVTKQLPNLTPMEATCNFRFSQYTVKSIGREHFGSNEESAKIPSGGSIGQIVSGFFK